MTRRTVRFLLAVTTLLVLGACADVASDKHKVVEPVTLEETDVEGIARITLTDSAARRLDIQTVAVKETEEGIVVPSDAIFIDTTGTYWVYTNPAPLVYRRHEIGVADNDGERVLLTSGPDPGVQVVTVGVPELYGAETGIGK